MARKPPSISKVKEDLHHISEFGSSYSSKWQDRAEKVPPQQVKAIYRKEHPSLFNHHITNAKAPDVKAGDHPSVQAAKNTGGSGKGNPYHDSKTGEFTSK